MSTDPTPQTVFTLPRDLAVGDQIVWAEYAGPFPIERVRTIVAITKGRPAHGGETKYTIKFDNKFRSTVGPKARFLKVIQP